MANEIQVVASLQYTNLAKNIAAVLLAIQNGSKQFTIAGQNFQMETKSYPTTAGGTAIPVSALATLGWSILVNLDPTNFVQILSAVSGTVFGRLIAGGGIALLYWDSGITAPALLANTAACEVATLVLEQ